MVAENKKYCIITNNESIEIESVPVLTYAEFSSQIVELLKQKRIIVFLILLFLKPMD